MENEEIEQAIRAPKQWHTVEIKGNWKLTYRVGNSQGASAFGGYHLGIFANPYNGQKTFLRNVDNQSLQGLMVDKLVRTLHPDKNENEKLLISWLICHPEVTVVGVPNLDQKILNKKTKGKLTLTYVDFEELGKLDEDDYIDKLIGLLSLDKGTNALSLSKIRYVMAYLNMPYRDGRYDAITEKKSLRSKLKTFARSGISSAKLVNKAIGDLGLAQDTYEFKELVRLRVLVFTVGIYRFNNTPIGGDMASVFTFFDSHPEVKTEALTLLYKQL